jgi:hypothetical protein
MKKILLIFLTLFFTKAFSQEQIAYVHPHTTAAAIEELNNRVEEYDSRRLILIKIKELEKVGKIIISTEEFKIIQDRINSAPEKPSNENEQEFVYYAEKAKEKYISISDLINK